MRLLFMGTSPFAVASLEALVSAGHDVVGVVTQPDRPSGRGMKMHVSKVKEAAERLGLAIFQPEKIRQPESVEQVREFGPLDAIVVAAFGQIIPQTILDIPKYGCINVHASLLPKYRGAAPIQYAVLNGERVTGITTMLMDAGLDTGDILLKREIEIGPHETAGELEERLALVGAELLIETLKRLELGDIKPEPQDDSQATIARSIKREEGQIDWTRSAVDIVNKVRAFTQRPGVFTKVSDMPVKVINAEIGPQIPAGFTPGEVVGVSKDSLIIAAGEGSVRLVEVQPENRKRMTAGEFARGARITPREDNSI